MYHLKRRVLDAGSGTAFFFTGSCFSPDARWQAIEQPTYSYDFHATALHLLGIDHEQLTFYHNGIKRRLTDVHGKVIKEILT